MSKIVFSDEGKEYTLEFTRDSVRQMEQRGFVASRLVDAPMTVLPDLFYGSFLAHHKHIDRKVTDAIYDKMTNKRALVDQLTHMYNEPIEALMSDNVEGNGIEWTTT